MERKPVHLIMVTAENNNKYYDMVPKGDYIEIKYGRVDSTCTTITKPMKEWDKIYNSKVKKGYVDQSDLVADLVEKVKVKKDFEYLPIPNKVVAEIVDRLQDFAKKTIDSNYNIKANQVTQAMIDKAQNVLVDLTNCQTVSSFNSTLLKLFTVIPRKMGNVSSYLANSKDDFGKIISKEQDLLDVMKGQVIVVQLSEPSNEDEEYKNICTILEALGIVIEETTEEDVKLIKKELGDCADRYHNSWRIKNIKNEERFKKFCKEEGLKKKDIKLLFHGTRNENVWSILKTGLVLRPTNAVITGKMFGMGIYNAPRARKSLGYTSFGYWTRGSANTGFMILHEVAYGKPYDVYAFDSKYYNLDYKKLQEYCPGANCLHAHAGMKNSGGYGSLQNDEIVVYKEEQMNAKYLIEVR